MLAKTKEPWQDSKLSKLASVISFYGKEKHTQKSQKSKACVKQIINYTDNIGKHAAVLKGTD